VVWVQLQVLWQNGGIITTSIDLTPKAVKNTKKRLEFLKEDYLEIKTLKKCIVKVDDAEKLSFKDNTFDFVVSWGVIHHSPYTEKCINEIYRVLKPGGRTSGMVYNKNSIVYYLHYMLLRGILMGKFLKYNAKQLADRYADGFQFGEGCPKAEHFTRKKWYHMMKKAGFKKIPLSGSSQTSDIGVFGTNKILDKIIPNSIYSLIFKKWGYFLVWNKVKK
jgi:ubiquinone/menaquinone biosynthesis C-methylase UbiE